MPKATPAMARMARMIVVAMSALGFLGSVGGVDGGVDGSTMGGVGVTGSTVIWFGVSDLFSFVVDAPSGARGFAVPVLSWSVCYLV